MSNAFYWVRISHWKYGVREERYKYPTEFPLLSEFLRVAMDDDWTIDCMKVMNKGV